MEDLEIRGAGDLLGGEQSGFINEIGFETYQKILEEAIQELKEKDFKDLFAEELAKERKYVRDVEIDTDFEMWIPDDYVSVIEERLSLYTELDSIENEADLEKFRQMLHDRFGPVPKVVENLFDGLRLRWLCKDLGFERLTMKNNVLRGYFVSDPQSSYYEGKVFNNIMEYVSKNGERKEISIKQSRNFLIFIKKDVSTLSKARRELQKLYRAANVEEIIM